jgi:LysM repeat protein
MQRKRGVIWVILAAALAAPAAGCTSAILDLDSTGSVSKQQASFNQQASPVMFDGRVYALRGMMGTVFSTGMDDLAAELNSHGLHASVYDRDGQDVAENAIAEYKAAPERTRIMLVGHSDGADTVIAIARKLKDAGVPVALAVTFDPTRVFSKPVPSNVERFVNLYQSSNLLGGGSAKRDPDFHGHFSNVNLREHLDISHITIDKTRALHEAIIPKFLQVATFSATPDDGAVALDYAVPKNATIEVWDSGIAIRAESGDTVESLAARYSVPAWGIRRVNALDDDAAITAGQRLVIPRYIATPAATARLLTGPSLATR